MRDMIPRDLWRLFSSLAAHGLYMYALTLMTDTPCDFDMHGRGPSHFNAYQTDPLWIRRIFVTRRGSEE